MDTTLAEHTVIGVDDYLAGELESEVRHECVGGQVYPMVGAIESLQEYVLVAQDVRRVEVYRRADDWAPSIHTEGPVRLVSLGTEVTVEAIYEDL